MTIMRRAPRRILTALAAGVMLLVGDTQLAAAALDVKTPNSTWYSTRYNEPAHGDHRRIEVGLYFDPGGIPRRGAGQIEPGVFYMHQLYSQFSVGGYVGFQVLPQGEKILIFSWWDALSVYCAGVPNLTRCGTFTGEGSGYTVQSRFDWLEGREYTFKVWYGWGDSSGRWFNADLIDTWTGVARPIGSIKIPNSFGYLQGIVHEITENIAWSRTDTCQQVPYSDAWRGAPRFDGVMPANHVNFYRGTQCTAFVGDHNNGVVQRFGTKIT